MEDGPTLFARLPASEQRAILGPAKHAAYRAGQLRLEDLADFRDDPRWGRVGYERSLREGLGAAEARVATHVVRIGRIRSAELSEAERLILDMAEGVRAGLSAQELQLIREHVARAGFSPTLMMPADPRVVGLRPPSGGPPLVRNEPVNVGELHYLRHVVRQREWPAGTTLGDYYGSGEDLALDPRSGVLVSTMGRFGIHVAVVGRSSRARGPEGHAWMLLEYRLNTGGWATLMQLRYGLQHFNDPARSGKRWLRLPR